MTETKPIRILIVDDHAVVREGLRGFLAIEPGITVAGEAADGVEAVAQARALQPDVILLDLMMPRKDGLAAIHDIKRENPQARILVLTSFNHPEKVFTALKAGALGYLIKDSSPEALIKAIRDVYHRQLSLDASIALKMIREFDRSSDQSLPEDSLTEREIETLQLLAQGLTNQEIADELIISERTVGKHVSNILGKLHLVNRTQAALYALRHGWASLDSDEQTIHNFT